MAMIDIDAILRFGSALKLSLALSAFLTLGSCASERLGNLDEAVDLTGYDQGTPTTDTASSDTLHGDAQRFLQGRDIQAQWWELFESDGLNALVSTALENNAELQAAEANLLQAQESFSARTGNRLPRVDLLAGVERRQFSGASFGQPDFPSSLFSLYNASIDVSYDFDFFGRTSYALEALAAQVEYERFRREATYISLTANVIAYAVQAASLQEQIAVIESMAEGERERLALMQQDLALGALSRAVVVAQEANLAELMASLPPLRRELATAHSQLAVLTGQMPDNDVSGTFTLAEFELPREIPLSLASDLLQQRPDIRMSGALLLAANAELGVAEANLLPQITLTGSYGGLTSSASDLLSSDSVLWNIGAGLTQPLFRGGALGHEKEAAVAGLESAAAQYRHTVLEAFQDVALSLQVLQFDADTLAAQSAAEQAAATNLELVEQQFEIGAVDYISLLDAQRQYQRSRIALVQSQATRITDTAALFHALGGGWWNLDNP